MSDAPAPSARHHSPIIFLLGFPLRIGEILDVRPCAPTLAFLVLSSIMSTHEVQPSDGGPMKVTARSGRPLDVAHTDNVSISFSDLRKHEAHQHSMLDGVTVSAHDGVVTTAPAVTSMGSGETKDPRSGLRSEEAESQQIQCSGPRLSQVKSTPKLGLLSKFRQKLSSMSKIGKRWATEVSDDSFVDPLDSTLNADPTADEAPTAGTIRVSQTITQTVTPSTDGGDCPKRVPSA